MSWILVPLQYMFLRWKAEKLQAKASSSKEAHVHARALRGAMKATEAVELMQARFPKVTDRIDEMRRRDLIQESYKA
jgi:hypothetical protein